MLVRPLAASDALDRSWPLDGSGFPVWAVGPVSEGSTADKPVVLYHSLQVWGRRRAGSRDGRGPKAVAARQRWRRRLSYLRPCSCVITTLASDTAAAARHGLRRCCSCPGGPGLPHQPWGLVSALQLRTPAG